MRHEEELPRWELLSRPFPITPCAEQLAGFQAKVSSSGRATFEGAGDASDDAVISLALAWFCAKNRPQPARFIKLDWMAR
jgi:hypothetical protein